MAFSPMGDINLPWVAETYGAAGIIILILLWVVRSLWLENKELNKEIRQAIREVFPAMAALQTAIEFIKGRGGNG